MIGICVPEFTLNGNLEWAVNSCAWFDGIYILTESKESSSDADSLSDKVQLPMNLISSLRNLNTYHIKYYIYENTKVKFAEFLFYLLETDIHFYFEKVKVFPICYEIVAMAISTEPSGCLFEFQLQKTNV